jgi:hypothetical protein
MIKFFREAMADLANQIWHLLASFATWLVLTGSAKRVVGWAILVGIMAWISTVRVRNERE